MKDFYVTFGQRYRHEPHPSGYPIHPDGVVRVRAESEEEARGKTFEAFGGKWSFVYVEEEFEPEWYPRGELFSIE